MDLPVSSTGSILVNLYINYQVYWKTFVNMHSINVILIYAARYMPRSLKPAYIDLATPGTWHPVKHFSSYSSYTWRILHADWSYTEVLMSGPLTKVSWFVHTPQTAIGTHAPALRQVGRHKSEKQTQKLMNMKL